MDTLQKLTKCFSLSILAIGISAGVLHGQNTPIVASPSQLTFNAPNGTATPQNLIISTSGGATNFSISTSSTGWLSVTPQVGTTPQVLSVSANAGSLSAGTYAGFITVNAGNASTTVPVILNVNLTGATSLTSAPSSLTFTFS